MAGFEGLDARFAKALEQMIADSGGRMWIVSGFRSVEEQQSLWDNAVAKYGPDEARNWVAPPGSSNHNKGVAVDFGYSDGGLAWAHANAARYGLMYPMDHEPWHIEPMGVRDGTYHSDAGHDHTVSTDPNASPYTDPPTGVLGATDPGRNFDLATQLQRLVGFMTEPPEESTMPKTRPEIYT
jgi:hypothetical protein